MRVQLHLRGFVPRRTKRWKVEQERMRRKHADIVGASKTRQEEQRREFEKAQRQEAAADEEGAFGIGGKEGPAGPKGGKGEKATSGK